MVKNGTTTSYTYNNKNQLLTEIGGGTTYTYVYDRNGNLLSKTGGGSAVTYTWNWRNLLLSVSGAGNNTSYEYDGDGTRLSKTQAGVKTKYINDRVFGLAQVLMETDNTGVMQAIYNYGNDLISMNRAGVNSYYHYDGLGSTRQLTDSSQAIVASYTYDSFGNSVSSVSSVANTYGFTGEQQFSEADNLVFLRARYYKPSIGRFISRDPILTPIHIGGYVGWLLPYLDLIDRPQSLHPYVYVQNNPVNLVDFTGLCDPIFYPGLYPCPSVPPSIPSICKDAWAPGPKLACKMACGAAAGACVGFCPSIACKIACGAAAAACMNACDSLPADWGY